MKACESKIN